jgi:pilus assembly protein Flp/PilA
MLAVLSKFMRDEGGATAIEYGLIAALISVVIITVLTAVGTSLEAVFQTVSTNLSNAG